MKVIIPMAGHGNRFVEKGYRAPKPLIKVAGKRIIEYILDMFDEHDDIVFICNDYHLQNTNIRKVLINLRPDATIVEMPSHKKGPVFTVKEAYHLINDDEEVIVSYCDSPYIWDYEDFKCYVSNNKLDGCLLTHSGFHPHTLSDTKMAFIKEKNGLLTEIKEKECYTDDPMGEHASGGAYYFSQGRYIKKYFDATIDQNINHNGEYYVTLVYNLLAKDGLRVGYYDTPYSIMMGTPEEVANIEAWNIIVNNSQIKTNDELINCFEYWKLYYETNIS